MLLLITYNDSGIGSVSTVDKVHALSGALGQLRGSIDTRSSDDGSGSGLDACHDGGNGEGDLVEHHLVGYF